jgi:hypothetical protein
MINEAVIYRNTCCACCGIPQVSPKYFQKLDGTLVRHTLDHDKLRSLGGLNTADNLVSMCYDCNQTRGDLFAGLQEYIDWYWSEEPLPKVKNFSYLREKPKSAEVFVKRGASVKRSGSFLRLNKGFVHNSTENDIRPENNITVLPNQNKSVPTRIIEMNGVKYQEYKHPLFGKSLIKIED